MKQNNKKIFVVVKSIFQVLWDILRYLGISNWVKILLIIGLLYLSNSASVFSPIVVMDLIKAVIPSLLGFSITAYTVLFALPSPIQKRLQYKVKGKKPFEVLHASFVFGLIIQCLTLIFAFVSEIWMYIGLRNICCSGLLFSILWTINIALHLYSTRTYIKGTIEEEKEQQLKIKK